MSEQSKTATHRKTSATPATWENPLRSMDELYGDVWWILSDDKGDLRADVTNSELELERHLAAAREILQGLRQEKP